MFLKGRLAMPSVGRENVRHATLLFCAEGVDLGQKMARKKENRGCRMANRVDINEFNALVERSEGSDRKKQEIYLVRVLKSLVDERAERGMKRSDDNILKVLKVSSMECVYILAKTRGDIYSLVAKSLLDNSDLGFDVVRAEIAERIMVTINHDEKSSKK
jgi:hypothetical protein